MTNKLGTSTTNNVLDNSDYGSTSFISDTTASKDGEKKQVQNSKNGIVNGNSASKSSSTSAVKSTKDEKNLPAPQELKGCDSGQELSSGPNEKPHSLNSQSRYTLTGSNGSGEGDDTETLQLVDRGHERELTNTEAILHLFKVFTGPSTIGMPSVMKTGGILFGSLGFLLFGYLTAYGNIIVVNCGRLLCKRTKISSLRYQELMELAILSYSDSKRIRKFATFVRHLTTVMLCLCQFGILAFYIQVIGTIVQSVLEKADVNYNLPLYVTKIFISLALVPYSWMKNLKILSWFSMIANISILVCVVTILQYAIRNLQPVSSLPYITEDPWMIPLFVSASVFTVEGVPMGQLSGYPRSLSPSRCLGRPMCRLLPDVLTFPSHHMHKWYLVISLLYGLMVFLTYTLQLFLPAEFIVDALLVKSRSDLFKKYVDILVRTLLVLASYIMTCLVSDIGLIMSLTGALCSTPLLFLFPSIGELILLQKEPGGIPKYVLVRNVTLFVFGLITCIAGTFMAVVGIVDRLQ